MFETQKSIAEIDKNLAVAETISKDGLRFYNVKNAPFEIYGLYEPKSEGKFRRMPQEVADTVSEAVGGLSRNTAGGRVRFSTDSGTVAIIAKVSHVGRMPHFTLVGTCGFDLYLDDPVTGHSRSIKPFIPPYKVENEYESKISFSSRRQRYFTVYFPLYSDVDELWIGVKEDASLGEGLKYRPVAPIVFYGSSITQGGCASRPGNAYENIITRRMEIDHINLGFSGSGKGEDAIIEYMAGLSMSAFVSDYDHNAPSADHLAVTHRKMYDAVRETHPDIPYIMVSKCDVDSNFETGVAYRRAIYENYMYARSKNDRNVYFLDGAGIFRGEGEMVATVDSVHPNDHGFFLMANAIEAELKRGFTQMLI